MTRPRSGPVGLRVEDVGPVPLEVGSATHEHVVVVLGGTCSAAFAGGPEWSGLGGRADVFDGRATAVYVPRGRTCRFGGTARLAVASAPATTSREPYVVRPKDVRIEVRGRDSWEREVHDIVVADRPADQLLVGETFHARGTWSAYPPHRHDRHDPPHEAHLVEAFLIRVEPASGFGLLLEYPEAGDARATREVTDGDIVAVDSGYHSFVAAAGHRFYYLWVIAGPDRDLRFRVDPRHEWLDERP